MFVAAVLMIGPFPCMRFAAAADQRPNIVLVLADEGGSVEASLAENFNRTPMNPADECDAFKHFIDKGASAEDVARGPEQIAARLRLGLGPLASISHDVRVIVCEGDTAVTEHVEHWEWPSGERASLPFVSVQQVRDGAFVRWWDYWDLGALMNHAPAWWVEHIMAESARIGLRSDDATATDA